MIMLQNGGYTTIEIQSTDTENGLNRYQLIL